MAIKPYKSSLIPYEDEIVALRRRKPPVPYAEIADLLRQKYNLTIQRAAIFKFIKVRSRGRKMYCYLGSTTPKRSTTDNPSPQASDAGSNPSSSKPKFEFIYSERYNLKRLPKEEAAAIRKKLEAEGH